MAADQVLPLKALRSCNARVTIKVRVIEREVRHFRIPGGAQGKALLTQVEDSDGTQMRLSIFNDLVDKHSNLQAGNTYFITDPNVRPADQLFAAPGNTSEYELYLNEQSVVRLDGDQRSTQDPEVDRIRKGLVALKRARKMSSISDVQHRHLKLLLFDNNSILQGAIEVYDSQKDMQDLVHTCVRLLASTNITSAPFTTVTPPVPSVSLFASPSSLQNSSAPTIRVVSSPTNYSGDSPEVMQTATPLPSSFGANSGATSAPSGPRLSFASPLQVGMQSPSSPFSFGVIPSPSKPLFGSANVGSPSVASPPSFFASDNSNLLFGGSSVQLPPSAASQKSGDATDDVRSLLDKVTVRQAADADDEGGLSFIEVMRQLSSGVAQERVSFPTCSAQEFANLCNAAQGKAQRLRVLLSTPEQIAPLASLIEASACLTSLDLSHSTVSAADFATLLLGAAASNTLKSVNAEFCKLQDNSELCDAVERCLQSNTSLRKLNFDGNYLSDNFMAAFARGLRSNRTLELVHFATNMTITPTGLKSLVDALDDNTTLKGVHLYANPNLRGSPLLQDMLAKLQKNIRPKSF